MSENPTNQGSRAEAPWHIMRYELTHHRTELGTGWFAPEPVQDLDFEDALAYMEEHPYDDFMHNHLLSLAGRFGPNLTRQLIERAKEESPHLLALMYESCVLNERLHELTSEFNGQDIKGLAQYTPLIYTNWSLKKDRNHNDYWLRLFSDNILRHKESTPLEHLERPIPFAQEALDAWQRRVVSVAELRREYDPRAPQADVASKPSPGEAATRAMERLEAIDLKMGSEEKNQASLFPYALQMQWRLHVYTSTGRDHWELFGLQTSYGKGLSLDQTRASCLMEVVERVSSFASFDSDMALHYKDGHALVHACYEDLAKRSHDVLDPNDMPLEVPYENQPLYWVLGERVDHKGTHPVYVPAQFVFLFCNLDEVSLTSGQPSTGLASGNTMEEAKLHALLEIIERDAEKVMPYAPEKCFLLESDLTPVHDILQQCRKDGFEVQFLDMTSEFGIPCYKAFIQGPDGAILKGCAAHLDGKRAAVSALTEVPFHSSWFHPVPMVHGLKVVKANSLPNYSAGHVTHDLNILERLLAANGYRPIYVNLTRKDLDIPVVKTLVPGLEIFAEFDQFSTLSLRQFGHYINALK